MPGSAKRCAGAPCRASAEAGSWELGYLSARGLSGWAPFMPQGKRHRVAHNCPGYARRAITTAFTL